MECLLNIWIYEQNQCQTPVSQKLIQEKAKHLFEDLKSKGGESSQSETFHASRGWFEKLKRRSNLHNFKVIDKTASMDTEVAEPFPHQLAAIIEKSEYSHQVLIVDETGYFGNGCLHKDFHFQRGKKHAWVQTSKR